MAHFRSILVSVRFCRRTLLSPRNGCTTSPLALRERRTENRTSPLRRRKTPDGKPDFSGICAPVDGNGKVFRDLGGGGVVIPMLPWANALYNKRVETSRKARRPSVALARE